jgi:hypothetical protein
LPLLIARERTEQGGMDHAMRAQIGLAFLEPPKDSVSFHDAILPVS